MSRDERSLITQYTAVADQYRRLEAVATDADTRTICRILAGQADDSAAELSSLIIERIRVAQG